MVPAKELTLMNKKLLLLICFLSFAACSQLGQLSSLTNNDQSTESSSDSLEGGAIQEVVIDAENGEAQIDFDQVKDSEEFVLALYNYDKQGGESSLQVASANDPVSTKDETSGDHLWYGKAVAQVTTDFHEKLRAEEVNLDPKLSLTDSDTDSQFQTAKKQSGPEVGSHQTFKALDSLADSQAYQLRDAVLMKKTPHVLAYLDADDVDNNRLTSDDIEKIINNFEKRYDRELEIMGAYPSDVNHDGRITIFFSGSVNRLTSGGSGFITGFFNAADLFDYDRSNRREMLYIFVPSDGFDNTTAVNKDFAMSNIYQGVLFHEFQHLLNFNMKVKVAGGTPEKPAFNEGLSHLMEDIVSVDLNLPYSDLHYNYMPHAGIENVSRVQLYLSEPSLCFSCGATLPQRGGSYLFLRYLYEQAQKGLLPNVKSGDEFIQLLINGPETGETNIVNTVIGNEDHVEKDFQQLLGRFGLSLFMSGTDLSKNKKLQIDGLDLRGKNADNRSTVLDGPALLSDQTLPVTSDLGGASMAYIRLTADQIKEAGNSLKLYTGNATHTGAYLIQTGL